MKQINNMSVADSADFEKKESDDKLAVKLVAMAEGTKKFTRITAKYIFVTVLYIIAFIAIVNIVVGMVRNVAK